MPAGTGDFSGMPDRKCSSAVGKGSGRPGKALSGVTISVDLRVKNMLGPPFLQGNIGGQRQKPNPHYTSITPALLGRMRLPAGQHRLIPR